jgi:hypothetical protein
MTQTNFNWFLHVMLFYYTRRVIKRQQDDQGDGTADKDDPEFEDIDSEDEADPEFEDLYE